MFVVMFDLDPGDDIQSRYANIAQWFRSNCPNCVEVEQRVWLIYRSPFSRDEIAGIVNQPFQSDGGVAIFEVSSSNWHFRAGNDPLERLKRKGPPV